MSDINKLNVREADLLEVTIIVDNYTDTLLAENTGVYQRLQIPFPQILLAEHGLSCLIKVYAGNEEHVVLMDAAVTPLPAFLETPIFLRLILAG